MTLAVCKMSILFEQCDPAWWNVLLTSVAALPSVRSLPSTESAFRLSMCLKGSLTLQAGMTVGYENELTIFCQNCTFFGGHLSRCLSHCLRAPDMRNRYTRAAADNPAVTGTDQAIYLLNSTFYCGRQIPVVSPLRTKANDTQVPGLSFSTLPELSWRLMGMAGRSAGPVLHPARPAGCPGRR